MDDVGRRALVRRSALLLTGTGLTAGTGSAGADSATEPTDAESTAETGGRRQAEGSGATTDSGSEAIGVADVRRKQAAPLWPQFEHDARNTGASGVASGPTSRPRLEWWMDLGASFQGAPIVADGRVYAHLEGASESEGVAQNVVVALDAATGAVEWETETGGYRQGTPAYADGTVYVGGSETGPVRALDAATGEERWSTSAGSGAFTPLAVAEGTVVASTSDQVIAFEADDGRERWRTSAETSDGHGKAPAVADGTVYAVHDHGFDSWRLIALSLADGSEEWSAEGSAEAGPAVVGGGRVYVGGQSGHWAFEADTGREVWSVDENGSMSTSPAYRDETLYTFGGGEKRDAATGERQWGDEAPDVHADTTGALADGVLYAANRGLDGVVAVDADSGARRWVAPVWGLLNRPPAVGDGAVYVGDEAGYLYAFVDGSGDPPTAEFSVSPDSPRMGETTTLDASPTEAGDAEIEHYWWQFDVKDRQTGQALEREFFEPGETSVFLFVVDGNGFTAATRRQFEVEVGPTATSLPESTTVAPGSNTGTSTAATTPAPTPTTTVSTPPTPRRTTTGAGDGTGADGPLSVVPGGVATVAGGAGLALTGALAAKFAGLSKDDSDDGPTAGETAPTGGETPDDAGQSRTDEGLSPAARDQQETVTLPDDGDADRGAGKSGSAPAAAERARRTEAGDDDGADPRNALGSGPPFEAFDRGDPVRTVGPVRTMPARGPNDERAVLTAFAPDEAATVEKADVAAFAEGVARWERVDDHDAVATVLATGFDPLPWVAHERRGRPVETVDDTPDPVGAVVDVAEGVHHLHRYGVAHGALTPASVWVDVDGAVLADVGLAPFLPVPDAYRPPEGGDPTPAADVYQTGTLAADLFGDLDDDRTDGTAVRRVLERAVAPPEDRYETALHVRDALREATGDERG